MDCLAYTVNLFALQLLTQYDGYVNHKQRFVMWNEANFHRMCRKVPWSLAYR